MNGARCSALSDTDSILQVLDANRNVVFEWNSWGDLPWDEMHYSAADYAHIKMFVPPVELDTFVVSCISSEVRARDPGLVWLAERIDAAAAVTAVP